MKIYLSGPIHACNDEQAKGWREQIKTAMPEHEYIDPMDRDYREVDVSQNFIYLEVVSGDLKDIVECDLMLVNAHKPSWGTAMEMWFAFEKGIPIVTICGTNHPWLLYVSELLVDNIDAAVMAITHYPLCVTRS